MFNMRIIYLYKKFEEDGEILIYLARLLKQDLDIIYSVTESRYSFRKIDGIKNNDNAESVIIVKNFLSLGMNTSEIISRINHLLSKDIVLVCSTVRATYEYGLNTQINKAVWSVICQFFNDTTVLKPVFQHSAGRGRPAAEYPEGWAGKYKDWEAGKMSSKEFMEWSGLKKATFYNKITEYSQLIALNKKFIQDSKAV